MRVSAIIPTYNRVSYLPTAIDSILDQTRPVDELLVIDDGSTDATPTLKRHYAGRVLWHQKPNGGKSTALNYALQHVTGDVIWIFDDDDYAFPEALQFHLSGYGASNDVAFTYSPHLVGNQAPDGNWVIEKLAPLRVADPDSLFAWLLQGNFIGHPAITVRRVCYDAVGGFDETLVRSQDFDMLLRITRRFRGEAVLNPTFVRREHPGLRGNANRPHDGTSKTASWAVYDDSIFRRLHAELELGEYLPPSEGLSYEDPAGPRGAHLWRASAMARHGAWDLAIADLSHACRFDAGPLREAERNACVQAFEGHNDACFEAFRRSRRFRRALLDALRGVPARQVRALVARSIYWTARDRFAHRNISSAATLLLLVAQLLIL